ncbi:MAG: class I SAM-dependent methyltransferase [Lachnospiraceae bacterium]
MLTMPEKLELGDVEETALIPLACRASETLRRHPRIRDPKAVEIIRSLQADVHRYDKLITHECVVARTILFDETTRALLQTYPRALCVNLGCGLDDRFSRADNGQIRWFDVDLADLIRVRRKVFSDTDRRKMISGSVLDGGWADGISAADRQRPVIVIAEGLFMYFSREENQKILRSLTAQFPRGTLVVELMHQSMMKENLHDTVRETNAKFGWGTDSGHELELLEPKMKLVSEQSFAKELLKSTPVSRLIGLFSMKINNRIAVFTW